MTTETPPINPATAFNFAANPSQGLDQSLGLGFDPANVGRRMKLVQDAVPMLADEPAALLAIAQQPLDDTAMVQNAASAAGTAVWTKKASQLQALPDSWQRGEWANLAPDAQALLAQAGYSPPDAPEHHDAGLLGDALGGVGHAVGALAGATGQVLGPVFHALDVVGDVPAHAYRTGSATYQRLAGHGVHNPLDFAGALGISVLAGNPLTSPVGAAILGKTVGPKRFADTWMATGKGERYFTAPVTQHARELLTKAIPDTDVGAETFGTSPDDLLSIAREIAGGTDPQKLLDRLAVPGSPEYKQAAAELEHWSTDPAFKGAIRTLQRGKISLGRDLMRGLGVSESNGAFGTFSGLADAGFSIAADPTLTAGKVLEAERLARYGLRLGTGVDYSGRVNELFERSPAVKRAFGTIAEHADAGDWHGLLRKMPALKSFATTLVEHHATTGLHSAEDVRDFFAGSDALRALLEGRAASYRHGIVELPHLGPVARASYQTRAVMEKVVDFGVDAGIEARAAYDTTGRRGLRAFPTPKGSVINLDPFVGLSRFAKSFTSHVPREAMVPLFGPEAPAEIGKLVDLGLLADMPSWARHKWFNQIVGAPTVDTRLSAVKGLLGEMFARMPDSPEVAAYRDRFIDNVDQMYSNVVTRTLDDGTVLNTELGKIPGLPGKYGLLPVNDQASALAIPNAREFIGQGRRISMWRSMFGWTNAGMVDSFMSRAWKPSVLLRLGFIPRAAGEELVQWLVGAPLAWPKVQALRAAAADTEESVLARLNQHLLDQSKLPLDASGLDQALTQVVGQGRAVRLHPNFDSFLSTARQHPLLREVPGDELRKLWELRIHAPQTLLRPFQPLVGATSAIARPWKDQVEELTQRYVELGRPIDKARQQAAKKVAETRRAWNVVDPFARAAHNMVTAADPTHGPAILDHLDLWARDALFHVSHGYRTALRRVMNADDIAAMRNALSDPVLARAFARHASSGSAALFESPEQGRELVTVPVYKQGELVDTQMFTPGSEYVARPLSAGEGPPDGLAPHALWQGWGHFAGDPIGREVLGPMTRYLSPDTQAELVGRFGGTLFSRQNLDALDATANARRAPEAVFRFLDMAQGLDPAVGPQLEAALMAGDAAHFDTLRAGLRALTPEQMGAATFTDVAESQHALDVLVGNLENLSPRTQRQLGYLMNQTRDRAGEGQLWGDVLDLYTNDSELARAQMDAGLAAINDPQHADDVRKGIRNSVGSATGEPVANAPRAGHVRLYVPLADRDALAQAGGTVAAPRLASAEAGVVRIGAGDNERRFVVGHDRDAVSAMFADSDQPLVPFSSLAVSDPGEARALSQELQRALGVEANTEGTVGYLDVPTAEARRPVGDITQRVHRVHYGADSGMNLHTSYYRVDPAALLDHVPQPLHLAPTTLADGSLGFGITEEEARRQWASHLVARSHELFMDPRRREVLHEGLANVLLDQDKPLFEPFGARIFRSSTHDVLKVAGKDLPAVAYGPQYVLPAEDLWSRFVRWGFDRVIGPAIDSTVRKPLFLHNYLTAYKEALPAVEHFRDPELFGRHRIDVYHRPEAQLLEDLPELRRLDPALQVELSADDHVVGLLRLQHPSDPMVARLRARFPEFPGFVLPGTEGTLDELGHLQWPDPRLPSPQLSAFMDENLHLVKNELERIADDPQLRSEAHSLLDVLDDATTRAAAGGPAEGATTTVIDAPRVRRFALPQVERTVEREGALHPLARRTGHDGPDSLVEAWARLDSGAKQAIRSGEPVPGAPPWAAGITPKDATILDAGAANKAAVDRQLRDVAIQRAVADTVPYIDDHRLRSQFQEWGRNVTPFWFAEEQFLKRWARRLVHSPEALRRGQLMYEGLKHGGVIRTDESGNDVLVYPGTPALNDLLGRALGHVPIANRMFGHGISFPIASMLTGQVKYASPGADRLGVPQVSPLVGIPLDNLANHFPELQSAEEQLLGSQGVGRGTIRGLVPSSVMRFYDALTADPESNAQFASAMNQTLTLLAAAGKVPPEDAPASQVEDFMDRVRNQTRVVLLTRALVGFTAPSAPQVRMVANDPRSAATELGVTLNDNQLQPEFTRLVRELGVADGMAEFLTRHPDATPYTVFGTTRPSGAPLPATADAANFMAHNQQWLAQYPHAGGWLLPPSDGRDKFSRRAYYQQLATDMRIRKAPEEFLRDIRFAGASEEYFTSKQRVDEAMGAHVGDDPGSIDYRADLQSRWRAWKASYFAQHPVFAAELEAGDSRARNAQVLTELRAAIADPSGPELPHRAELFQMLDGLRRYQFAVDQLYGDRRRDAQQMRAQLKDAFATWGSNYVLDHPQVQALWSGVVAPTAGLTSEDLPE